MSLIIDSLNVEGTMNVTGNTIFSGNVTGYKFIGDGQGLYNITGSSVYLSAATYSNGSLFLTNSNGSVVSTPITGLTSDITKEISELQRLIQVDVQNRQYSNIFSFSTAPVILASATTNSQLSGGVYTINFTIEHQGSGGGNKSLSTYLLGVNPTGGTIFTGQTFQVYAVNNQFNTTNGVAVRFLPLNTKLYVYGYASSGNIEVRNRNLTLYGVNNVLVLTGGTF